MHLMQTMYAGCRFFRKTFDAFKKFRKLVVNHHGQVTAIVQNHVQRLAVREEQRLFNAPIEFFRTHALPCVDWNTSHGDRGGSVVLSRKDIAAGPLHFRTQRGKRFDEHGRLDGHVQATCNAGTFERLGRRIFFTKCHQTWHLNFRNLNFLPAQFGQFDLCDLIRKGRHCTHEFNLACERNNISLKGIPQKWNQINGQNRCPNHK